MVERPTLRRSIVVEILKRKGVAPGSVALLAIRGYFEDSMGRPDVNDRGVYDDAIFVVGAGGEFRSFNANTDPSVYQRGIATLIPGVWQYKKGDHKISLPLGNPRRYPAFRQAEKVTVRRDGQAATDPNVLTINIHRGGDAGETQSEGCQTIPRDQWREFKAYVDGLLDNNRQKTFRYVLITNDEHEAIVKELTEGSDWDVILPNGSPFKPTRKSPEGRPTAPVRPLAEALGGDVEWLGKPTVNGTALKWYSLDGSVSWGLVREIAEACGFTVKVKGREVKISSSP